MHIIICKYLNNFVQAMLINPVNLIYKGLVYNFHYLFVGTFQFSLRA